MSKKVVLEEEKYVQALERIIERDFFPDLPRLRQQSQGSNTSASQARHADSTVRGESARAAPARSPLSEARSVSSSWDQPTPMRTVCDEHGNIPDHESAGADQTPRLEDITLNRFVATHTSEDNAAFTELQEQSIESHKSRYHWAYDNDRANSDPKLHLLSNGKWISAQERQIVDQVLAPKGPRDDRPTAPETWPYRARNSLLFVPDFKSSNQVSKVDIKLLRDDQDPAGSRVLTSFTSRSHEGVRARAKRETVYANSRFENDAGEKPMPENLAAPPCTHDVGLVEMTPLIAPGVDSSPLMTWGDIERTPIHIDSQKHGEHIASRSGFVVKESSAREQTAMRLESQTRASKSQSRQRNPTPLIFRGKRPNESATPSRTDSIRSRLSSVRSSLRTPLVGSNLELRASYSTPARPPRHSESRKSKK